MSPLALELYQFSSILQTSGKRYPHLLCAPPPRFFCLLNRPTTFSFLMCAVSVFSCFRIMAYLWCSLWLGHFISTPFILLLLSWFLHLLQVAVEISLLLSFLIPQVRLDSLILCPPSTLCFVLVFFTSPLHVCLLHKNMKSMGEGTVSVL